MTVAGTLERLFWTVLAAFLGALSVSGPLGLSALQAGAVAAASAGADFLLRIARWRLSVLPDPERPPG